MTVAAGDLWYFETSNGASAVDSIGRMTTSGVKTDYAIGYPSGITSFTIGRLITGPDGNVWFNAGSNGGLWLGKLDVVTGAITFYASGAAGYSSGYMASGADGNIYYTVKSSSSPAYSYLLSVDPASGVSAIVRTYDTYTRITGLAAGSDGRVWVTDGEYDRVYAEAVSAGADSTYYFTQSSTTSPDGIISGSDGNLWLQYGGNIIKMTTSGQKTTYVIDAGVSVQHLVSSADGAIWFADSDGVTPRLGRISGSNPVSYYEIPNTISNTGISDLVLGPDGAVWYGYATGISPREYRVGRATTTPTFSEFSITSTYKNPSLLTVAGGSMYYFERSAAATQTNYIGKMTSAGLTTDYLIGYPTGLTSFTVANIITGPDGNVWFNGYNGGLRFGKFDVSTGAITFYEGFGNTYTTGPMTAGPDGKIYYVIKSSYAPAVSYLRSLDTSTGLSTTVRTYDAYVNLTSLTFGPDGRIWVTDSVYKRLYAESITGGTSSAFNYATAADKIIAGPDGNLWYAQGGYIVKMTPAGPRTSYAVTAGTQISKLIAGSDGAVWYLDNNSTTPKISRITTAGVVTHYPIVAATGTSLAGIALGPDGAIWVTYSIGGSSPTYKLIRLGY